MISRLLLPAVARLAHAADADPGPQTPLDLRPWVGSSRYTFSHINVVIPHLPEPHRYLACMVLIGQSGTRLFDDDRAVRTTPTDTATVTIGTAVTTADDYHTYRIATDCDLRPDGSALRFGEELRVSGTFARYEVVIGQGDLTAELTVTCWGPVTWFARSPIYDHTGAPARVTGRIGWAGQHTAVDGLCSLELARAQGVHAVRDQVVPDRWKLPWDHFAYQVLAIDPATLLLLTHIGVASRDAFASAIVWRRGEQPTRLGRGVELTVVDHQPGRWRSPSGATSPVAARTRWRWPDRSGGRNEIEVCADELQHPGVGTGWIGGCAYSGTFEGAEVGGRGYVEYADRRRSSLPLTGK